MILGRVGKYRVITEQLDYQLYYTYITVVRPRIRLKERLLLRSEFLCYYWVEHEKWFYDGLHRKDIDSMQELTPSEKEKIYQIIEEYKLKAAL